MAKKKALKAEIVHLRDQISFVRSSLNAQLSREKQSRMAWQEKYFDLLNEVEDAEDVRNGEK